MRFLTEMITSRSARRLLLYTIITWFNFKRKCHHLNSLIMSVNWMRTFCFIPDLVLFLVVLLCKKWRVRRVTYVETAANRNLWCNSITIIFIAVHVCFCKKQLKNIFVIIKLDSSTNKFIYCVTSCNTFIF